jgi:hypothetical protein
MYVAQRAQAFVENGVSVPDPCSWRAGTDFYDFTVFESDLECGHVQNGQSSTHYLTMISTFTMISTCTYDTANGC